MTNLHKIYEGIHGTDAERRTHIESNAKSSAAMFQPRLETGPQNEVGDMAFSRNVIPPIVFDYISRFYPDLEPEAALGRMAAKQNRALDAKRDKIYKANVEAGLQKDREAFQQWKDKRECFIKNVAPSVRGETLGWGTHTVPGLGVKYDFKTQCNRSFGEITWSADHDQLVRRVLDRFIGWSEEVFTTKNRQRVVFTVQYAPRGV